MANSMSIVSNILEMYDFAFPNLSERLKCIICNGILKNAKQTECGCKVCDKCIRAHLSKDQHCPSGQPDCANTILSVNNIYTDHATNKEIANIIVKCPFKKCVFTDVLKFIEAHIEKCEFKEISCDKCGLTFIANAKKYHDQHVCENRKVPCSYCGNTMKFKDLRAVHLNPDSDELCTKYECVCPNKCSQLGRVKLREHLKTCENKKLECPFQGLTCNIGKLTKEALERHLNEEVISHSYSIVNEFKKLKESFENVSKELHVQKKIYEELNIIHEKSSESYFQLNKTIEELRKKPQPLNPTVINPILHRNATFIWKFNNFEEHKRAAELGTRVSVTSDPFYTSEFGYKMCLRLYPAGDGVGKGTHLSVFFAIMRGDFDDLLSWPFKQKVTLSILDQETGSKHHCDTFKPDSRSACYQKPTDDCNIASGSPKFIPLNLISNSSMYCKNDAIYLKINVDTIGISKP